MTTIRIPETMKAAVVAEPRHVVLREVPVPRPREGQVLVRLEGSGVCASNLTPWHGTPWTTYPLEPGELGHEAWGRIAALGDGVSGLAPGERVAILSYRAYAPYDVADARHVVRLPDDPLFADWPGEPFGCAMNIFARSDIRPGQTVAIIGIGFLGAILTRLAADAGARVIAITRRAFARDLATRMGAAETIAMDDHHAIIDRVKALTGGRFCERVIEAIGDQWPLDLAGELAAERGRLVIAGYHQDGPRQVNLWLWNWRGLDIVNAHERDPAIYTRGMADAVAAARRGLLDPKLLLTHRVPLERIGEAFDLLETRPDGFLKAMVTYP